MQTKFGCIEIPYFTLYIIYIIYCITKYLQDFIRDTLYNSSYFNYFVSIYVYHIFHICEKVSLEFVCQLFQKNSFELSI